MVKKTKKSGKLLKAGLVFIIAVTVLGFVLKLSLEKIYPTDYSEYVQKYSTLYGVDENLIYAVIKTESGFNKNALSEDDAKGLMQITPDTFNWIHSKLNDGEFTHDDMYNPEINIRYGVYLISYLLEEFDNTQTALAAYHAGRGVVNKWVKNPDYSSDGKTLDTIPYKDTDHYVYKVTRYYNIYLRLYK